MTSPLVLEMPEGPQELIPWLERKLCGFELGILIAELRVVHGEPSTRLTFDQLLGERREAFLRDGLTALTREQIRSMLLQPDLLAELQELILLSGEVHWMRLLQAEASEDTSASMWQRIETELFRKKAASAKKPPQASLVPWRKILSIAAVGLIAVAGWWGLQSPRSLSWGWNHAGVFTVRLTGDQYLRYLADEANEWFAQPRSSKLELKQRLNEFRKACDRLIDAEHLQLSPTDRAWLKERCVAWKGKIDGHLVDLENGEPLEKVRQAADGTVQTLIKVLRERKVVTT